MFDELSPEEKLRDALDDLCNSICSSIRQRLNSGAPRQIPLRDEQSPGGTLKPLPILADLDDPIGLPDGLGNGDSELEDDLASRFIVYIALEDGSMAAVTLSGRSVDLGSLSRMSVEDRVAFAMAGEKEWQAIVSAGAV